MCPVYLARVQAFRGNEHLFVLLVLDWVPEADLQTMTTLMLASVFELLSASTAALVTTALRCFV